VLCGEETGIRRQWKQNAEKYLDRGRLSERRMFFLEG
jgi:hypothetical protein